MFKFFASLVASAVFAVTPATACTVGYGVAATHVATVSFFQPTVQLVPTVSVAAPIVTVPAVGAQGAVAAPPVAVAAPVVAAPIVAAPVYAPVAVTTPIVATAVAVNPFIVHRTFGVSAGFFNPGFGFNRGIHVGVGAFNPAFGFNRGFGVGVSAFTPGFGFNRGFAVGGFVPRRAVSVTRTVTRIR